jgi:uncharacterized protein YkwD
MNRTLRTSVFILVATLTAIALSCNKDDDDDFTHVSALEKAIHEEINNYRSSVDLNELVLQFVMVKEAQQQSTDWANNGSVDQTYTTGLTDRWTTVINKLGGTNNRTILQSWSGEVDAQTIVNSWINNPSLDSILVGEYTQSGPGTASDSEGNLYVTQMFLNIPSK